MKRRGFLTGLAALCAASCARKESREARYDPAQCPFCTKKAGVCSYCMGNKKCAYCNGSGMRKTTTKNMPKENINPVTYEEKCPYCEGKGTCTYCEGTSKCWACDGTGHVDDWDFLGKLKKKSGNKS